MSSIKKYLRYKNQLSEYPSEDNGIFFAFSKEQFEEGMKSIKEKGWFNEGEKLLRVRNQL